MNFFERQAAVKKQSARLVLLFAMAVFGIVVAVDLVLLVALGGLGDGANPFPILVISTLGVLAVIGCATLFRVSSLRTGGAAVAQQLGATPVPENTTDYHLRRLRNVVEEIAIASGVPVPQIFVLNDEAGINAFAAGYSPSDAAVAVTRGALNSLNRDELQGVIAHEFSHILNGDMRLNIKLMGLLFGIMVMALIGQKILEHGRFRSKDAAPIIGVALGLMVIGYIGLFFGRMIKAGVSRQREYLADASAVQFTRQTKGIAGALKKIGGLHDGSKLANADAEEVSHMLFGQGLKLSSLMATHPPLMERIRRRRSRGLFMALLPHVLELVGCLLELRGQLRGEMQRYRGRGHGAFLLGEHGLVISLVRSVGRSLGGALECVSALPSSLLAASPPRCPTHSQ